MNSYCNVEIKGHIFDSLTLSKIMDVILSHNADCEVKNIKIGLKRNDLSSAKIRITAKSAEILSEIIEKIKKHGASVINDAASRIELRGHIVDTAHADVSLYALNCRTKLLGISPSSFQTLDDDLDGVPGISGVGAHLTISLSLILLNKVLNHFLLFV
jgi:hypothetical protein